MGELVNRRRRGIAGIVSMVVGAACLVWALPGNAGAETDQEPPPTPSSSVVGGDEKNPDCGDLGDFEFEFKIDDIVDLPEEKTYIDPVTGIEVTIFDVHVEGGIAFFSFTSTIPVSAVFVKSSTGGILYTFDPPTTTGIDLASPNDSISHISFCWNPPPATTTTAPTTTSTSTTSTTLAPTTTSTSTTSTTLAPTTTSTSTTLAPTTTSTSTTSTTAPTTTSTSTTEKPTTTSTTEAPTSTTVVAPSTTTTSLAAAPIGQLPKTGGGSQTMLLVAGITLLLGGAALAASAKLGQKPLAEA